jgi:hypothetical protein
MFDFEVKDELLRSFLAPAGVGFGIVLSLAMRPAWRQIPATMK